MNKKYQFTYNNGEADAVFNVDLSKLTSGIAKAYLEFFVWEYDVDADPIDELMKKYAIQAIKIATSYNYNAYGVKRWFADAEGFLELDGSEGIELTSVIGYTFDEDNLTLLTLY